MKIRIISVWNVLSICSFAYASEKIYHLQENASVSELVYELGIRPVYGRGEKLSEILRLNGITPEASRRLPVGFSVLIPEEYLPREEITESPKPTDPEEVKVSETPAPTPAPVDVSASTTFIKSGFFSYTGESEQGDNFSATGPWVSVNLVQSFATDDWKKDFLGEMKWATINYSAEDSYLLEARVQKRFSQLLDFGGGVGLSYDYFIVEREDSYRILQGFIPRIFLSSSYQWQAISIEGKLGMTLPSALEENKKSEANPLGELKLSQELGESWSAGIELAHEKKNLRDFAQSNTEIGFLLGRSF